MDRRQAPAGSAPTDRFCDVVMKGGITSGIVYPGFIAELARHFRLKNIGGTSAGAIAAIAAAAAEYRRRQAGDDDAFEALAKLPEQLAADSVSGYGSTLFNLFQPSPKTRRVYAVLTAALNARNTYTRLLAIAFGLIRAYWLTTLVALVCAGWVAHKYGSLPAALAFVAILPLMIAGCLYWDITRHVVGNSYGLCTGMTERGYGQKALTPWLSRFVE